MKRTFVIVGAGLAGVSAAGALRAEGFDGRLVLVGGEPHLPYDRPPLSKGLLLGEQTPADIQLHHENFYVENEIELMLGTHVARVDPVERRVTFGSGEGLVVDKLLLCTGGTPRHLDVPGHDLEGIHYLRTLDDALAIQDQLNVHGSLVVVGAGFIGAEVAAAARERGYGVTLIEIAPTPLGHALGEHIGGIYASLHRERGVDLRTGVGVAGFNGPDRVWEVITTDGATIPADVVVVGIGMSPETHLAQDAGLAVDNGILVDECGQTSLDGVFAAGDAARRLDPRSGKYVRHEHWQGARNHATAVGSSMLGNRQPFGEVPWFWSEQYGINLQTAGQPLAGDDVVIRGDIEGMSFTAFYLQGDCVIGVIGIDRPRDVRAAMTLIEHRVPVGATTLSDDNTDLRQLAKRHLSGSAIDRSGL